MNVLANPKVLTKTGHIKSHDKLFVLHGDSLWRDVNCGSDVVKNSFLHNTVFFKLPCAFTISPGATSYHTAKDVGCAKFKSDSKYSAFLSITSVGVNDISTCYRTILSKACEFGLTNAFLPCPCCEAAANNENLDIELAHKIPGYILAFSS